MNHTEFVAQILVTAWLKLCIKLLMAAVNNPHIGINNQWKWDPSFGMQVQGYPESEWGNKYPRTNSGWHCLAFTTFDQTKSSGTIIQESCFGTCSDLLVTTTTRGEMNSSMFGSWNVMILWVGSAQTLAKLTIFQTLCLKHRNQLVFEPWQIMVLKQGLESLHFTSLSRTVKLNAIRSTSKPTKSLTFQTMTNPSSCCGISWTSWGCSSSTRWLLGGGA